MLVIFFHKLKEHCKILHVSKRQTILEHVSWMSKVENVKLCHFYSGTVIALWTLNHLICRKVSLPNVYSLNYKQQLPKFEGYQLPFTLSQRAIWYVRLSNPSIAPSFTLRFKRRKVFLLEMKRYDFISNYPSTQREFFNIWSQISSKIVRPFFLLQQLLLV